MKPKESRWILSAVLAVLALFAGATYLQRAVMTEGLRSSQARARVARWPETPRLLAAMMIERYGAPDEETSERLMWFERDAWKRIAVNRMPSESPFEQTVGYLVLPEVEGALRAFGNGVSVDAIHDELSARGDRESLNLLALNVADDVAERRMTAAEGRAFFKKTADRAASGKNSAYMKGLRFAPYRPNPAPPLVWPRRGLI